jgi:hypothetical protein
MIFTPTLYLDYVKALAVANSILAHDGADHLSFFRSNQIDYFGTILESGYDNWAVLIMHPTKVLPRTNQASNFLGVLNISFDVLQPCEDINNLDEQQTILNNTYAAAAEMVSQIYEDYRIKSLTGDYDFIRGVDIDQGASILEIEEAMFNNTLGFTVTVPVLVKWK